MTVSILQDSPVAFRNFRGTLAPLSASVAFFFMFGSPLLILIALVPRKLQGPRLGPILVFLPAAQRVFMVLAVFRNLTQVSVLSFSSQLLFLVVCLTLAFGVQQYQLAWKYQAYSTIGLGAPITLLSMPLVLGFGFLLAWEWAYRTAAHDGPLSWLWVLGFLVCSVGIVMVLVRANGRIRAGRWLAIGALLVFLSPVAELLPERGRNRAFSASPKTVHTVHKLILLSIDTLRADAVSALAPHASRTPSLDSLAADSVVFTRAFSASSWTLPSFGSIMTGVTPLVHGLYSPVVRIPDALPTLAEQMQGAGYVTAAVGQNHWLTGKGLPRGFESYCVGERFDSGRSIGLLVLEKIFPMRFKRNLETEDITGFAGQWLLKHAHDDFFLWIHYYKPHGPYEPRDGFRPAGNPPPEIGFSFGGAPASRAGTLVVSLDERPWVRKLYEGEVRFVDSNVGSLLSTLKRLGIYDETLIVFVSDHGEEFWEHGGYEHGQSLYNELLHVPLFVKLPGQSLKARRDELVGTGSIYPTLLDLAGKHRGPERLSYASLLPLLSTTSASFIESPLVSAKPRYYEDRDSVIFGETKYIHSLLSGREELYNLRLDSGEQHDLAATSPEGLLAARKVMEEQLQSGAALRLSYGIHEASPSEIDRENLERLRSLGYVR